MYNWHRVDEGLYRSAQMYGGCSATLLMAHGIVSVINLRGENPDSTWYLPERDTCTLLGIDYINRPLHSRRLPKREMLLRLIEAFRTAEGPILIKCSGGADRTGLAAAIYLLNKNGPTALEAARRQMAFLPYLHLPKRHQRWIRRFLDFFEVDHAGLSIADWARLSYAPDRFADWLLTNKFGGTWVP